MPQFGNLKHLTFLTDHFELSFLHLQKVLAGGFQIQVLPGQFSDLAKCCLKLGDEKGSGYIMKVLSSISSNAGWGEGFENLDTFQVHHPISVTPPKMWEGLDQVCCAHILLWTVSNPLSEYYCFRCSISAWSIWNVSSLWKGKRNKSYFPESPVILFSVLFDKIGECKTSCLMGNGKVHWFNICLILFLLSSYWLWYLRVYHGTNPRWTESGRARSRSYSLSYLQLTTYTEYDRLH